MALANEALAAAGYSYGGSVKVTHLMAVLVNEVGREALAAKVTRALRGLRLAPFYGCQLLRPGAVTGNPAPDDPRGLETLIEALRRHAGRPRRASQVLRLADHRGRGAAAVTAGRGAGGGHRRRRPRHRHALPALPHLARRLSAEGDRLAGRRLQIPVLHLSQLVGLALGFSPLELRLNRHVVPTAPALRRLGLAPR